jgi:hypothetical protein
MIRAIRVDHTKLYKWLIKLINEAKAEGSTRLTYSGLHEGLEHLKIETRLIYDRFASVMGGCVI